MSADRSPGSPQPVVTTEMLDKGFQPDGADPVEIRAKSSYTPGNEDSSNQVADNVADEATPDTGEDASDGADTPSRFSGYLEQPGQVSDEELDRIYAYTGADVDNSEFRLQEENKIGRLADLLPGLEEATGNNDLTDPDSPLQFALDDLRDQLENAVKKDILRELMVTGAVRVTGATLSAGYLAWLLRAGPMVASLVASLPVWARFDPLPVLLTDPERKKSDLAAEDEDDEAAEQEKAAARILDGSGEVDPQSSGAPA
ncbi:MAG: hypothetical protein O7F73_03005 [Gammaproteobacteria bacterium]|nr:hypothetical protein [Gammaproteobacteria bacterium]